MFQVTKYESIARAVGTNHWLTMKMEFYSLPTFGITHLNLSLLNGLANMRNLHGLLEDWSKY